MNRSWSRILIHFPRSIVMSSITCLYLATTFNTCCSISIALCYASAIACTFVSCGTSTYTFVDNFCSVTTTFSSLASFCIVYSSTKCYSIASSSFNSFMNTISTDVVHAFFFLLHSNIVCFCAKIQL